MGTPNGTGEGNFARFAFWGASEFQMMGERIGNALGVAFTHGRRERKAQCLRVIAVGARQDRDGVPGAVVVVVDNSAYTSVIRINMLNIA